MKSIRSTLMMKYSVKELKKFKRIEKSVVDHDVSHELMMVNEADMDFRIPELPRSVVKYAHSMSVRQMSQKIENHRDRHAFR